MNSQLPSSRKSASKVSRLEDHSRVSPEVPYTGRRRCELHSLASFPRIQGLWTRISAGPKPAPAPPPTKVGVVVPGRLPARGHSVRASGRDWRGGGSQRGLWTRRGQNAPRPPARPRTEGGRCLAMPSPARPPAWLGRVGRRLGCGSPVAGCYSSPSSCS
jgi:hypothetical protein